MGLAGPLELEVNSPETVPSHVEVGHEGFGLCFVNGNCVSKEP